MPDIRLSPLIDDFERADENPVQPPWINSFTGDMKIEGGTLQGTEFPPVRSAAHHSDFYLYGPRMEIWAMATGSPAETAGWRFGLLSAYGENGYECLPHNPIGGGNPWILRRHDGFTDTQINVGTSALVAGDLVCMILDATGVHCYRSTDDGDNWTLVVEAGDMAYRTGLYPTLGTTGTETGWAHVGAGNRNRTQIYRYVSN